MVLGLERDALEAAQLRLGQSVEIAKPGIGHGPVGIEEAVDGQVLASISRKYSTGSALMLVSSQSS